MNEPRQMRITSSFAVALTLVLAPAVPATAQESAPPMLTPPGEGPGDDGAPNVLPPPGDENSPMIVPPPDESPDETPDAFGSAPSAEDEPDAAPVDQAEDAVRPDESREEKIDRLFSELRKQPDGAKAGRIAGRIEREWRRSGSATIDLLMQRAATAMGKKDNAAAMDVLDQTLVLDPAYAEAWNRRATLNFAMDRWGKSLADIEQTLAREPRHWGALMGLAMILERLDEKEKAFDTYMRVLAVYPALKSAQDAAGRLADEITGPVI
ncbi:tetratricopeptide repeat protein [Jiella avicenniae]|uniref:Tetratricopeptide repeat-containing protein n=1 Tax=Jiella avicenniae TaxID=2907202 RepID=A0A9X1T502_9HYPH|nr:hypothetical protein [Jiella avicenniae]MCE7028344.1 hypothetical protein [Jiella avicenniae]